MGVSFGGLLLMIFESFQEWDQVLACDTTNLLDKARTLSWDIHGKRLQCFIPGQMVYIDQRGQYPAISLTGTKCALRCDHCYGRILESMISVPEPNDLQTLCRKLDDDGNIGVLLSGGSDKSGFLPWNTYLDAIHWIKCHTGLKISIHTGTAVPACAFSRQRIDALRREIGI